ncbi:hypothetical protein DPMN_117334 [Dreissena polymorpha]|uniref:Ig-like domain-containing protein n=1 Tax=Dreissena polymorpha TaxID=45954 RepID=A0A9D4KPP8_DREPO|nr:hypothetical protein DPMN_117334 [Dreissena polymorpha]
MPGLFVHSAYDSSSVVCNGPQKLRSFLNVPDKDFLCISPKVLRCEQTPYSVDINQPLSIVCKFDGDSAPEIKWTRPDGHEYNGRNTSEGAYEVTQNGTLIVNGVTMSDYGEWKVMAYNKTASDEMPITVHVITTTISTSKTSTTTTTTTTTTPRPTTTKLTKPTMQFSIAASTPLLTKAMQTRSTTDLYATDESTLSGAYINSEQTAADSGPLIGGIVTAAVVSALATVGIIAYCFMKK